MATYILLDTVGRNIEDLKDPLNYSSPSSMVAGWNPETATVKGIPSDPATSVQDFASVIDVKSVTLPYPRVELWGELFTVTAISGGRIQVPDLTDGTMIMTSAGKWNNYGINPDVKYWVVNADPTSFELSLTAGGVAVPLLDDPAIDLDLTIVTPEVLDQVKKTKAMYDSPLLMMRLCVRSESDDNRIRTYSTDSQNIRPYQFALKAAGVEVDESQTPRWAVFVSLHEQVLRWGLNKPINVGFATIDGCPVDTFEENKKFPTDVFHAKKFKRSIILFGVTPFVRDARYSNHYADIRE